ncbi:MAG: UDP-N-acetylmuramoyl-tripeptide--D-alanyl-D-alanine ligase [Thermoflavifilum sp.]|nr:UDP-N-acetylmuramoyl-tripeptide--D-alanyl-D-alanine ligase [Thermoflavifilum sp.]MCL6513917.1 UDP-N-acetylmuramoyl-tripeptide--D-alanyl-D-alanine ligase [Alicyclobacillus sp.]
MEPISVQTLCERTGGTLVHGDAQARVTGVSIDSRRVAAGDVFVAFRGEHVDGHHFVADAFARGAAAALVQVRPAAMPSGGAVIQVDDPLAALQRLATAERQAFTGPVIGVTGSNGKTTTKHLLASVFSVLGPCLATEGNYNNELGLPLTILRRTPAHRSMVLEMGMRGKGQIAALCAIAKPSAGVITNIGHSHIELLGSQAAIADAKAELLDALPADGTAVLWYEDPWLQRMASRSRARVLWYGMDAPHAQARDIEVRWEGTTFQATVLGHTARVFLPLHGAHNVRNALAALLMGAVHGVPLSLGAEALRTIAPVAGRLNLREGSADRRILDDAYNASPASVKESLRVLRTLADDRPSVAILGDMLELGAYEQEGHEDVGCAAVEAGVTTLIAVGPRARHIAQAAERSAAAKASSTRVLWFADVERLLSELQALVPERAVVLVKASRAMAFERIVQCLTDGMTPSV